MLLIASLRRTGSWRIPNRPCFINLTRRKLRLFTEETVTQPPRLFFGEKGSRRSSTIELGTSELSPITLFLCLALRRVSARTDTFILSNSRVYLSDHYSSSTRKSPEYSKEYQILILKISNSQQNGYRRALEQVLFEHSKISINNQERQQSAP